MQRNSEIPFKYENLPAYLLDYTCNSSWCHLSELFTKEEINDEVDRSIDDQREMIEAGKTHEPARRNKAGATGDEVICHDNLITVEDDTGDVTAEEHKHNTDDDNCQIDLLLDTLSVTTMGISRKKFIALIQWMFYIYIKAISYRIPLCIL